MRNASIILFAAVLTASSSALATDLDEAVALEEAGRLPEAIEAFGRALRSEGNTRQQLATIYLHLAALQQASGDREGARQSMYRLLAVDPEPELPDSAPPDVAELLAEATRLWAGRRLGGEVRGPAELPSDGIARVSVTVTDDVAGMVAAAAIISGEDTLARQDGRGPFEMELPSEVPPPGENLIVEARLLDEHGGIIWQGGEVAIHRLSESAPPSEPPPSQAPREGPGGVLWTAGWSVLAAGVLLAGGGGALVGVDQMPTGQTRTSDAGTEEEILNTDLSGWVLVGVGGAALVVGTVLLVLGARGGESQAAVARLARGVVVEF